MLSWSLESHIPFIIIFYNTSVKDSIFPDKK